ncbi:hypothetical protein BH10BDE1_BH10BDE1_27320 [soil metagenome]
MSAFNRRTFLALSALSAAGLATWTELAGKASTRRGRLAMTYETSAENGVALMNLDTAEFKTFATPRNVHYIETSKRNPHFGIGANKYGRYFSEIDLQTGTVVEVHQVDEDLSLMGHMALSDDGQFLCATATDASNRNLILKMDPKSFRVLDRISIGVENPAPHDLRFMRGSRTLLTTSARALTYVDFSTNKVTHRRVKDLSDESVIRHFGANEAGQVAIQANSIGDLNKPVWKYGKGEIVTASHDSNLSPEHIRTFHPTGDFTTQFDRELLDFAFSADGMIFGATMNRQPLVTFWDFKTGQIIHSLWIPGANRIGLTHNRSHFIVFGRFGVRYISAATLEHDPSLNQFDAEFAALFPKTVSPVFGHKSLLEPA